MTPQESHKTPGGRIARPGPAEIRTRPAAREPILEVRDLKVGFSQANGLPPVLDGVSFTLHPGEILGLVGASGSGKSLLAKSIIRLEKPARILSGSILVNGEDIAYFSQKKVRPFRGRQVAYVPQNPLSALDPVYSIGFQFREVLKSHTNGNRADHHFPPSNGTNLLSQILDWLSRVDISEARTRIGQFPHQWSRGMLQRALLAMSFASSPRIIILDEVTSALDPTITLQIINLIGTLRDQRQTAVILITHDLAIAHEICDSIAVLHRGLIVEKGKAKNILHHPGHEYTRQLVSNITV